MINENLRIKEELTRLNAALGGMRLQTQYLLNARMEGQLVVSHKNERPGGHTATSNITIERDQGEAHDRILRRTGRTNDTGQEPRLEFVPSIAYSAFR